MASLYPLLQVIPRFGTSRGDRHQEKGHRSRICWKMQSLLDHRSMA